MKKLGAMLLALLLLLTCTSQAEVATATDMANAPLTVGTTTAMTGNLFSTLFYTSSSDLDAQELVLGYNLVQWNPDKKNFEINTAAVASAEATEDVNGNRIYTFRLQNDLKYSDGSAIMAKDYAFSYLLRHAPAMRAVGAMVNPESPIVGGAKYLAADAGVIKGVRLLDELTLSVAVDRSMNGYGYALSLLSCFPYPIEDIAPGMEIADEGEGILIRGGEGLTANLLKQTLLDETAGYLSHPARVSGAYVPSAMESGDLQKLELTRNPYYKTPAPKGMEKIVFVTGNADTLLDMLESGELSLATRMTRSADLERGDAVVSAAGLQKSTYMRNGSSFISFSSERKLLRDATVRQAIARCMDRETIVRDYVDAHGKVVNGYYGLGQWMTVRAEEEKALDNLFPYSFDPEAAKKQLVRQGWILNANGGRYQDGDAARARYIDGELVVLELKLVYPEGNKIAESLSANFAENLAKAGIALKLEPLPFRELQIVFHSPGYRDADMVFMALNYGLVFDPLDSVKVGNPFGLYDEELDRLAQQLRLTNPESTDAYYQHWLEFQQRWSKVLPSIPLYSNEYADYYAAALKNYDIANASSWVAAATGATWGQ